MGRSAMACGLVSTTHKQVIGYAAWRAVDINARCVRCQRALAAIVGEWMLTIPSKAGAP
jgi:hypothetical protein